MFFEAQHLDPHVDPQILHSHLQQTSLHRRRVVILSLTIMEVEHHS